MLFWWTTRRKVDHCIAESLKNPLQAILARLDRLDETEYTVKAVSLALEALSREVATSLATSGSGFQEVGEQLDCMKREWSDAQFELDKTFRKVHSELGYINRAKREGDPTPEEQVAPDQTQIPLSMMSKARLVKQSGSE